MAKCQMIEINLAAVDILVSIITGMGELQGSISDL